MNPKKKKTMKGYAVLFSDGEIMTKFDHSDSAFAPRIYKTAEGARNVARSIFTGKGAHGIVVPCTITYEV